MSDQRDSPDTAEDLNTLSPEIDRLRERIDDAIQAERRSGSDRRSAMRPWRRERRNTFWTAK